MVAQLQRLIKVVYEALFYVYAWYKTETFHVMLVFEERLEFR